jgi:predicted DCC family thiol-disulfide oxidoreductase YuxK
MNAPQPNASPVLLFDGVCNLCNGVVQFVLRHDVSGEIKFASQQSEVGEQLLAARGIHGMQSVVLIEGEGVYTHSDAALRLLHYLPAPWRWLASLRIIPQPLRELVYNFIARYRYNIFGKREACWLPKPEWKARFLDGASV